MGVGVRRGAAARGWVATWAGCGPRAAAPGLRSAVSATSADCTPGMARTAFSAASRTGSQAFTVAASTVSEKNTLPSLTTMSDSTRASGKVSPVGEATFARAARTCSLLTAMIVIPELASLPLCAATIGKTAGRVNARASQGHAGVEGQVRSFL